MFRARGCSAEEAADLAQDAAIRAFVHIRRWGVASGGLDPLLNRIARNLLIDRYRRTAPHLVPLDSAHEIHDPAQDPTEEVARRQRRRAVHHAIRELPTRHQSAIKYSLSGMTPEEVGKQLGIGRNAADALLHRARRSLKEHLAPVRDGMWGLALGFRIRFDRVFRRAGIDSGGADATIAAAANSAFNAAAAALVAVLTVTGGGGGGGTQLTSRPALGGAVQKAVPVSSVTTSTSDTSSLNGGGLPPGGSGVSSYNHGGFVHGTYTNDSSHNNIDLPSEDPDAPLLGIDFDLRRNGPGSSTPTVVDQACSLLGLCAGS